MGRPPKQRARALTVTEITAAVGVQKRFEAMDTRIDHRLDGCCEGDIVAGPPFREGAGGNEKRAANKQIDRHQ